jgi:transcription termination/antitermination protein NusG
MSSAVAQTTISAIPRPEFMPEWFAVQTKPRHEQTVVSQLRRSGIEHFLPLISETRRWSDRSKKVAFPLFPCYIFVHMVENWANLAVVFKTAGVLHILSRGGKCEAIPSAQIESVRRLVGSDLAISSHCFLHTGDKVRIRGGSLDGVTGILEERDGEKKLVVSVHLLSQSICISLNGYDLEKV